MDVPTGRLERWRDAGLLTDEQVRAIVAYEQDGADPSPDAAGPTGSRHRRGVLVEAIGYVGGALAVGAVALMLGDVWDQLADGGRLAVVVLLTVLLGGAGLALRSAPQTSLARLAGVLLVGAIGGVTWTVTLLTADIAGWAVRDVALAASGAAAIAAVACYLAVPRALVQVALLASIGSWISALLLRPALPPDGIWIGLAFWTLGVGWALLGRGGWLVPRRVAQVLGAVLALLAMQGASFDDHRVLALVWGLATAAALVGLAVAVEELPPLVVGAVGLFVLVPQLVFELFGDAIGAPAALLVVGLLLVLLAVGLGRAHREVREEDTR